MEARKTLVASLILGNLATVSIWVLVGNDFPLSWKLVGFVVSASIVVFCLFAVLSHREPEEMDRVYVMAYVLGRYERHDIARDVMVIADNCLATLKRSIDFLRFCDLTFYYMKGERYDLYLKSTSADVKKAFADFVQQVDQLKK